MEVYSIKKPMMKMRYDTMFYLNTKSEDIHDQFMIFKLFSRLVDVDLL